MAIEANHEKGRERPTRTRGREYCCLRARDEGPRPGGLLGEWGRGKLQPLAVQQNSLQTDILELVCVSPKTGAYLLGVVHTLRANMNKYDGRGTSPGSAQDHAAAVTIILVWK